MADANRAAFVTQPYRYSFNKTTDPGILAIYPNSQPITIDTNLDKAGAEELAVAMFKVIKSPGRTFTLTIADKMFLEDFTAQPPRYVCVFDQHPSAGTNIIYTVINARLNQFADRTTLTVRAQ